MPRAKNREPRRARLGLVVAVLTLAWPALGQTNVVLYLKNGDRLAGAIVSEDTNRVVLATSWLPELPVPQAVIERREVLPAANPNAVAINPPAPVVSSNAVTLPKPVTAPVAAAGPKLWTANVNVGLNLVYGATDSQLYYGTLKLTYEQPYKSNPKKFFRNVFGYTANYGETAGKESANNMGGTVKTDFDVGEHLYLYNAGAVGYDTIRKINLYYSVGPGVGYHLFTQPKWVANVESGLSYQAQYRSAGGNVESVYLRAAEDVTWKISDRVSFTQKYEFFQNLETGDQFRWQFNATLEYSLWQGVSLNLSALDLYDTNPAPGVDKNELQVRSSIGIAF